MSPAMTSEIGVRGLEMDSGAGPPFQRGKSVLRRSARRGWEECLWLRLHFASTDSNEDFPAVLAFDVTESDPSTVGSDSHFFLTCVQFHYGHEITGDIDIGLRDCIESKLDTGLINELNLERACANDVAVGEKQNLIPYGVAEIDSTFVIVARWVCDTGSVGMGLEDRVVGWKVAGCGLEEVNACMELPCEAHGNGYACNG